MDFLIEVIIILIELFNDKFQSIWCCDSLWTVVLLNFLWNNIYFNVV